MMPSLPASKPSRFEHWPTSHTVHGIPERYFHCYLQNYETDSDGMVTALEKFASGIRPNLILTGDPGRGKTHLSVGLYRWAVSLVGTWRALWLDFPNFVDQVKRSYNHPGEDPFEVVHEAKYFIALDDIFGRDLSPHERDRILYPAIQAAHRSQTRLVVTTNYSKEQIRDLLAPHEFDRLFEGAQHLHSAGESRRR